MDGEEEDGAREIDLALAWAEEELATTERLSCGHYLAGKAFERADRQLSYAVTAVSAIAGTSILSLADDRAPQWAGIIAGAVALLVAVLSGVRTVGRFAERAEKHKIAGARFDELVATARANRILVADMTESDVSTAAERIEAAHKRRSELGREMLALPDRFWNRTAPKTRPG